MHQPTITPISFTYKKPDNKVWVLNIDDLPIDQTQILDQQIVYFAPLGIGGNHKHRRREWFVGFGDLELVWLDENNQKHQIQMNPNDELLLIEIPPDLPHAVINKSQTQSAVLYEWADQKAVEPEPIKVI